MWLSRRRSFRFEFRWFLFVFMIYLIILRFWIRLTGASGSRKLRKVCQGTGLLLVGDSTGGVEGRIYARFEHEWRVRLIWYHLSTKLDLHIFYHTILKPRILFTSAEIMARHVEGKKLEKTVWNLLNFNALVKYHVKVTSELLLTLTH